MNPYEPPRPEPGLKRPPRRAILEVGSHERHVVEVFLSLLGTEVYVVDDTEVLRLTSLAIRGERQFEVGDAEGHLVQVKLDAWPSWKCLIKPDWIAEVYVDGQVTIEDLFPVMRRRVIAIHRVVNLLLLVAVGVLLLTVLTFVVLLRLIPELLPL